MIRFWLRHYRLGLAVLLLLTGPSAYYAAKLFGNLKPDLEELLPRKSRAILDLEEIRARLKSVQKLDVLIHTSDGAAGKRFQEALATALETYPLTEVASVEYRIDRELKYFSDRKSLFLELGDLKGIRKYIVDRIEYEKLLYNPLTIFSGVETPEPRYDFRTLESKYSTRSSSYSHFPDGYYSLPDGTWRLISVYEPASKSGVTETYAFRDLVSGTIAKLNPASFAPDLEVHYTGNVQDVLEEHAALVNDVERSALIVFTIVFLALLLFFRSLWATFALLLSLFLARFWTFGISYFLVGYLNANSAFMGSIVLGSGITFGVMLLARYIEERRLGKGPVRSAYRAIRTTTRATWTAALCAGFAYGSLFLTEFEGFKQYGIIGLVGMVLCWISSVLVLPGILLEIERHRRIWKGKIKPRSAWIFGPMTRMLGRFPKTILVASLLITVASIAGFSRFHPDSILERDLSKLRNKDSMTKGSGFYGRFVDQILQAPSSPVVVLAHSKESAERITAKLKEIQKKDGKDSLIQSVADIDQFIPVEQREKIAVMREIRAALPPSILKHLSGDDRTKAEDLLKGQSFSPITLGTLPPLVQNKFTEKDGSIGKLVLVDSRDDSARWSGPQLNEFVGEIRQTADEIEGRKVPVAGSLTVTSDMIASIIKDGPKATVFAFLAVTLLVFIIFRHIKTSILMLSALLVGSIWLAGGILWFDVKINFVNFIAFPITFGIGVDYGVNIFPPVPARQGSRHPPHRARDRGGRGPLQFHDDHRVLVAPDRQKPGVRQLRFTRGPRRNRVSRRRRHRRAGLDRLARSEERRYLIFRQIFP